MHFTVEQALNIQLIERCQLVAGLRGINRTIRSISIMDTPDTTWLKRGDLLLTTGYVFKDDTNTQIKLIQEMAKRECAGLGIKVKRFFSSTPEAMILEANRLNFPLIEIPYDLALSDLLLFVTREIFSRESIFNEQNRKKVFFSELLKGEFTNREAVMNQLKEYRVFLSDRFHILYCIFNNDLHSSSKNSNDFYRLLNDVEAKFNLKLTGVKLDDYIIIAQSKDNSSSPARDIVNKAAIHIVNKFSDYFPGESITIGIGKCKDNILDIHSSCKEAKEAIQLGLQLDGKGKVYEYLAMEPELLLHQLPDIALKQFLSSTLKPLIIYDRQNDSDLLKTLEVFLLNRGKIEDTARVLFLHRNTVKFRVARIEELLKTDLKDGEELFRLQLGLRVVKLMGSNFDRSE
jgi:DNA-binding PucR family transcriptional regulator